ncbi:MAG: holo-ACP synthase [Eubacteriales bacterium]
MVKGIGADIIEIERLRILAEKYPGKFLNKIFTQGEVAYCNLRKNPFPSFAARFAAKEAVLKALGTGLAFGIRWRDVEIVTEIDQAPKISLHNKAVEIAVEKGIGKVLISISHDRDKALAFALVLGG